MLGRGAGEDRRFCGSKVFSNCLLTSSGIGSSMMFWATSWRVDSGISSSNWLRYLSTVSDSITLRNRISKWKIQGAQWFWGCRVVRGFYCKLGVGALLGVGRWKGNWHLPPLWAAILRSSSSRMSLAWILLARFFLLASKCETRLAPQEGHNCHSDCVSTPHLRHGFSLEFGRRLTWTWCCLYI